MKTTETTNRESSSEDEVDSSSDSESYSQTQSKPSTVIKKLPNKIDVSKKSQLTPSVNSIAAPKQHKSSASKNRTTQ